MSETAALLLVRSPFPRLRLLRQGVGTAHSNMGLAAFVVYLATSLAQYNSGRVGNFDLGIFSQAAAQWSSGHLPSSAIRELNPLLGDHFSPITLVFGLGWFIWPDPRSLLVVQAAALALGVALICQFAIRRLGRTRGVCVALSLAMSEGIASASTFDVHEVALAVPIMALLLIALCDQRWGLLVASSILLLLVKEDLGLTVLAAAGVWWWLTKKTRQAIILGGIGIAGFFIANIVIVVYNPEHQSPYLYFFGSGGPSSANRLTGPDWFSSAHLAAPILFVAMAGVVGTRSPIAVLAIPTFLWRLLADNPNYWSTSFHYDALLAPIAAVALIDVLRRAACKNWRSVVIAGGLLFSVNQGAHTFAATHVLTSAVWRASPMVTSIRQLADIIPDGTSIAAGNFVGPQLVSRFDVRKLKVGTQPVVQWAMFDKSDAEFGPSLTNWLVELRSRPDVQVWECRQVALVRFSQVSS